MILSAFVVLWYGYSLFFLTLKVLLQSPELGLTAPGLA